MALRVLDQCRRMVEPHRLVVQQRGIEGGRIVDLQIRAGIDDEREARRVRLGKPIERKRRDRQHDRIGGRADDAVGRHAGAQLALDLLHPLLRPLESHRPAQLLGFAAGESRHGHRHAQQLLLEERHAERALEDRLERRMGVDDRFLALAALQIRMHHLTDDRPRPDDGDLDDEIVEARRLEARQRRHLRPRLHLEDADRVGLLQHAVDGRIVGRETRQIQILAARIRRPAPDRAGPAALHPTHRGPAEAGHYVHHRRPAEAESGIDSRRESVHVDWRSRR